MPNVVPATLKPSHRLLAYLLAAGFTNAQCSKALKERGIKLNPVRISTIRQNPEMKRLIQAIQDEHMGGTVRSFTTELMQAAQPALRTISSLSQNAEKEETMLSAAKWIGDSFKDVAGLGKARESEGPQVKIVIEKDEAASFREAMSEVGIIDAEFTRVEPAGTAKTTKALVDVMEPTERIVESAAC